MYSEMQSVVRVLLPLAMLATLALGGSRAHAATFPSDYFGTHGNAVPSVLGRLAANGVGVERNDANWISAERVAPVGGRHTYQWTVLDKVVRTLAENGLRYYPLLHHTPVWARVVPTDPASPPAHVADYAAFVAAFASRYGEHGTFWVENPSVPYLPVRQYEIWNEPNSQNFWNPTPRPSEYFSLYRAAQQALHHVQPGALVVLGGVVESRFRDGVGWLRELEREVPGALHEADAVAFHPYLDNKAGIEARVRDLRQLLVDSGAAAVPIEITEFGAPAAEVSLSQWSSDLTATVRDLATSDCGITRIIAYRDQDPNTGTGVVDKYGYYVMYDRQGIETSLASAYFTGIAQARQAALNPTFSPNRLCGAAPRILSYRISAIPAAGHSPRRGSRLMDALHLVSYRLSETARVTFILQTWSAGRLVGRRCARPTPANRTRARCTRLVTLRGGFTRPGGISTNRFRFAGRVGTRRLAPRWYRLVAVAVDASGRHSTPVAHSFRTIS